MQRAQFLPPHCSCMFRSGEEGFVMITLVQYQISTDPSILSGVYAMSAYSASKFAVRGLTQAVGE